jgi:hypothetical protein
MQFAGLVRDKSIIHTAPAFDHGREEMLTLSVDIIMTRLSFWGIEVRSASIEHS